MEKRKALIKRQREVRIHAELWQTSDFLLEAGQIRPQGSAHQFRASLIFRAFFLEAFLNWLGPRLIPHWKYLERLKPREKLDLLTDHIQLKPDYGTRPWQIVKEVFDFRNTIAHGKPQNLEDEETANLEDFLSDVSVVFVQAEWERFAKEETALRAQEDIREIANILYEKAEVKHDGPLGPFSFGFQIREARF